MVAVQTVALLRFTRYFSTCALKRTSRQAIQTSSLAMLSTRSTSGVSMMDRMKLTQLRVWKKTVACIVAVTFPLTLAIAAQTTDVPRLGPPTLLKNGDI